MSKFVAKFRKERDYNDDNDYSQRKKRSNKHDPSKKLTGYNYDLLIMDEEYYGDSVKRKKSKSYY